MELLKHRKESLWDEKLSHDEKMDREDIFILSFAHRWFEFIQWLLIVGVIEYLRIETNSHFLVLALWVTSYGILLWYLNAVLFNTHFYRILPSRFLKNGRAVRVANVVIAAIPMYLIIKFLPEIVSLMSAAS